MSEKGTDLRLSNRNLKRKPKTRVSREEAAAEIEAAEDERKLQTKRFVRQCAEVVRRKPPLGIAEIKKIW